ncbi:hypothetical protein [Streptomyces sp. NPDC051569]|uniref:hypothetical protein n=1 Tax=Streptomyces sp. NPDC051569 TaxID=3365661 RepID=UPI0037A49600
MTGAARSGGDDEGKRVKRRRGRGLGALSGAAAMCVGLCAVVGSVGVLVATAGPVWAAGEPSPYVFDPAGKRVAGAMSTSDAKPLGTGGTYRDAIRPGGKLVYRLDLEARTSDYLSAVAVPRPGTEVAYGDQIKVSLQNREGADCAASSSHFGSAGFPRPLAAYAYRLTDRSGSRCAEAGTYFLVIERESGDASSADPWELEIRHVSEPALTEAGPTTAPSEWPSASPEPPEAAAGGPLEREGGTGFNDAKGLTRGEWTAKIEPGESLFYRVPVDWGQQLFASADLGSSEGSGYVSGALTLALYNPARGLVGTGNSVSYNGKQNTTSLTPLPPAAYENRFSPRSGVRDMRFAGWYYLEISLDPEVGATFGAKPYGLTLRVNVEGQANAGPGYAGSAGDFTVTPEMRTGALHGQDGQEAARSDRMALVATAGIGSGTVLLLGLGVWTLLARRRAAPEQPTRSTQPTQPYGGQPPSAW